MGYGRPGGGVVRGGRGGEPDAAVRWAAACGAAAAAVWLAQQLTRVLDTCLQLRDALLCTELLRAGGRRRLRGEV